MKFRVASDIHTEFFSPQEVIEIAETILPRLEDDKDTYLILAGDIGSQGDLPSLFAFFNEIHDRFKHIFYVMGNHEHYHGDALTTRQELRELLKSFESTVFLTTDGGTILPNGIGLHLHTLWTDFDKENPISMQEALYRMNDYRLIRKGHDILHPKDTLEAHKAHLSALESMIKPGDIVVTHHSPCLKSIPGEYLTDRVNGAYHSDLSELILDKKPAVWCHGHTHTACTYLLSETQIICNPRGYGNQFKKNGYNPTLVFEV